MQRPIIAIVLAIGGALVACSPTFDWREVRLPPSPLMAMMPCKPERETRQVEMAGQAATLSMASCKAGSLTLAVGVLAMPGPERVAAALEQWQRATLQSMRARDVSRTTQSVGGPGASVVAQAVRARGQAPDGQAIELHGLWFARGDTGHAALVFGAAAPAEVLEAFHAGLRWP